MFFILFFIFFVSFMVNYCYEITPCCWVCRSTSCAFRFFFFKFFIRLKNKKNNLCFHILLLLSSSISRCGVIRCYLVCCISDCNVMDFLLLFFFFFSLSQSYWLCTRFQLFFKILLNKLFVC